MTEEKQTVDDDAYAGVTSSEVVLLPTPELPYRPIEPKEYRLGIALIGCGGITAQHLTAYRNAGYNVLALCDIDESRATERRDEYFPEAAVYTDYRDVLAREDVGVVDIATHPAARVEIIEAAINAKKHVLSQKPFVLDLDVGQRLCELADEQGVTLAVNQNGRWAPHVAYLRLAAEAGLLGELTSADLSVSFDHSWVVGTPFNDIYDLVLYDFAIHWFDMLMCYFGDLKPEKVFASVAVARGQTPKPPLLAHVIVDYPSAQATLSFNAATKFGHRDTTYLVGTEGTALSEGPGLQEQTVEIVKADGVIRPQLEGQWFPEGFHGAMSELLCAIEENRAPFHNAADNLESLALAFAAIGSTRDGLPKRPGEVRSIADL